MRQILERVSRSACRLLATGVLFSSAFFISAPAAAQSDPDLREIIPYLMLVIDTSGSMERLPACSCTTPSCEECLPKCALPNDGSGNPPKDAQGHETKKNRWAVVLEALTGSFANFQCEPIARTTDNGMDYDIGYYLPYHQPWDCTGQLAETPCAYNDTTHSTLSQNQNGIIDTYANRVRFGLMTFDGFDTYVGAPPLVSVTDFQNNANLSNGVQGLWSYGGGHSFHYPNCTVDYMIDTGVRSATADQGTLVSLNSCLGPGAPGTPNCPSWCSTCPADQASISADIQKALLKTRPYGGTPIAASLDDLYVHLKDDLADQFGSCRHRYALLMTDGYPDDDYRSFQCNCANEGNGLCGGSDPAQMHCPYPTAEETADYLIHGRPNTTDKPMIEQLFVVGLAIDDSSVLGRLNDIAKAGCPKIGGCDTDHDGNEALFANDLNKLVQNLSAVINSLIEPVSRSVPAFSTGTSVATNRTQYQLNSGFEVATEVGEPWSGVLERRVFKCSTTGQLAEDTIEGTASNKFHEVLNTRPPNERKLLSTVPLSGSPDGNMFWGISSDPCGTGRCTMTNLDTVATTTTLGGVTASERTNILAWMRGTSAVRATKRLGDIYHSSPVIVGAPQFDTSDEGFNLFRQRPEVAARPLTLYVGSNDGFLHAFSVEEYAGVPALSLPAFAAGQEMWGFVPPLLLNNLKDNLTRHQYTMDGTPTVKNVYFQRAKGEDSTGQEYHTVLITGMREGGNAYIALDVTDPTDPKFLWQFNDIDSGGNNVMGKTFGQAAIGQATFLDGAGNVKNGAVAILPGGVGEAGPSGISGDCTNGITNPTMKDGTASDAPPFKTTAPQVTGSLDISHRSDVRCWKDIGRVLYFVDIETGKTIKKIHRDSAGKLVFPSPLVSTPSIFGGDLGSRASRAFVTDADGVIWRIDLSADDQKNTIVYNNDKSADPNTGWVARPFHDIFWGTSPSAGELSYEAPVLSVDPEGNVVVIVGTGDNNNFVKPTIQNRVVSLTEKPTQPVANGPIVYKASLNWEKRVKSTGGLVPSELVTGTMGLFNGQLFFGTFIAVTGSDACDVGKGRIHAVDYLARDISDINSDSVTTYGPLKIPVDDSDGVINVDAANAVENFMVMGLGITQRPTCSVVDEVNFDVYGGKLPGISSLASPAVYLVAQASGDKGANSLIQKHGSSKLGSVELELNKIGTTSRVTSWATTVD